MEVDNVLVEEILVDEARRTGSVKSTLYEFKEPRWISIHREREGRRLGPMTLLDGSQEHDKGLDVLSRSFRARPLHTEGKPNKLVVSYRDRWTVPQWTVYALVLPKCFVASHLNLARRESTGWVPPLQLGVSHEERLFYHTVFEGAVFGGAERHIFDIEAKIELDERRYRELVKSAEAVRGTSEYESLRGAVGREVASLDFWFKLLELGRKLMGIS